MHHICNHNYSNHNRSGCIKLGAAYIQHMETINLAATPANDNRRASCDCDRCNVCNGCGDRRATQDGLCDACFVIASAEIAEVIDARRGGDEWMPRD